jgi:hypothetical protein
MFERTFNLAEVIDTTISKIDGGDDWGRRNGMPTLDITAHSWVEGSTFSGAGPDTIKGYVANGYDFPESDLTDVPYLLLQEGRRVKYNDCEGELDVDLALLGEIECFRQRVKRPRRAVGIRIVVNLSFSAVTPHRVISEYGTWTGSLLTLLRDNGYDLELVADIHHRRHPFSGAQVKRGEGKVHIELSKFGESLTDEWKYLFAPGGYRYFGFTAINMVGREGISVSSGLGKPYPYPGWDIKWDQDTYTLQVDSPSSPSAFPAARLSEQLNEILRSIT